MRCISLCMGVRVCVCGRLFDKWPDHLFKPISSNPRSQVKIECKFVPTLVDFNIRGSLISKAEVETNNCTRLIILKVSELFKAAKDKLHDAANSRANLTLRPNTLLKQRPRVPLYDNIRYRTPFIAQRLHYQGRQLSN